MVLIIIELGPQVCFVRLFQPKFDSGSYVEEHFFIGNLISKTKRTILNLCSIKDMSGETNLL